MNSYEWIVKNLPNWESRRSFQKTTEYQQFHNTWKQKGYGSIRRIGAVISLIHDLKKNSDISRKDWVDHYFQYGRTPENIQSQVQEIARKENISESKALLHWWIHSIDNAWIGFWNEQEVKRILQKELEVQGEDLFVREATKEEDELMGIDLVVCRNVKGQSDQTFTQVIEGLQVKRLSYFYSKLPTTIKERTVTNPKRYEKFKNRHNSPVRYITIEDTLSSNTPCYRETHKG